MTWWVHIPPDGGALQQAFSTENPAAREGWEGQVLAANRKGDLERETYVQGVGWQEDLEKVRASVLRRIDRARLSAAQSMPRQPLHPAKLAEAHGILAGQAGVAVVLQAEAEALGRPLSDLAQDVVDAYTADMTAMAELEASLILAKARVRDASSVQEITTATMGVL